MVPGVLYVLYRRLTAASLLLAASAALAPAHAAAPAPSWHLIEDSCGKCHNSTDWAGGLAFDTLSKDDLGSEADIWEKTVRKLRGRLMPPPGEAQPDQKSIDSFVSWMEGSLDKTAARTSDPGYVGLHRLNRTEYAREIERILGLPIDVKTMLPKDVSNEGFDNLAASLRISPTFLDQYLGAARNVARLAVGRTDEKSSSHKYRANPAADQSSHIDGLPLGTRGGLAVDHYFPADGEYEFNIREFFFMGAGYVTKVDHPHRVILTLDGTRVFEQTAGGKDDQLAVDKRQAIAADEMQARFNHIRVKVKAGMHRIGAAFVQRSFAQSDSPLQPIAMLPEMERAPTIPGFEVSGPFNATGVSDTPSRQRIFSCRPTKREDEQACAKQILTRLAGQAFRRPVTDEDLKAPMAFYAMGRDAKDWEAGIENGLTAILASTKFLIREEPSITERSAGGSYALSGLELASRLSFFLWSEGPDAELMKLANAGTLREPAVLDAQIKRMLADPRAITLSTNFAFQWLNVGQMDNIQPDPTLYPKFDPTLREGYREEMKLFLDSILRSNRSVLDLLRADTTFVNERVATEYGIPNIRGAQFRPVKLANANRHGLFGKGAVLMSTVYGDRTSVVLRGSWIMEMILGTPPSPPPPGTTIDLTTKPGEKPKTLRARMEVHRAAKSCNSCHGVIDPLGFALENFDVVGAWRSKDLDAGQAIDARGGVFAEKTATGPQELSRAVLSRPDQFVQTLTEKLMTFALGRPLRHQDMPTVRAIVRDAAAQDYRFEAIVRGVVKADAFSRQLRPSTTPLIKTAQADAHTGR